MCFASQRRAFFEPKMLRTWQFLAVLTSKCALRHNAVHFPNISTSKSSPDLRCFAHFHLDMCFVPQRRALFEHLNFQKVIRTCSVFTFWCGNPLRAAVACTFSTSQLFSMFTSKSASRHNGAQFFISHLPRWLCTCRFSEPTFRPSGDPNHWKNIVFRNFSTFLHTCIYFLLTLSLLWSSFFFLSLLWLFPPLLFHPSLLSEVWLLNFLR